MVEKNNNFTHANGADEQRHNLHCGLKVDVHDDLHLTTYYNGVLNKGHVGTIGRLPFSVGNLAQWVSGHLRVYLAGVYVPREGLSLASVCIWILTSCASETGSPVSSSLKLPSPPKLTHLIDHGLLSPAKQPPQSKTLGTKIHNMLHNDTHCAGV